MTELTYADAIYAAAQPSTIQHEPGPEYGDDRRLFQGIPGIERTPGGRLWATWYAGGQGESPLNYTLLSTSADDGETWSGPVLVIDPPGHVRSCDPCLWLDPDGRLWLFWMQTHTLHDGRWGVWAITTDQPDAARPDWTAPRRLADGVMLNKPTVRANGEWLFPISLLGDGVLKNEKRMLPAFLRRYLLALIPPGELEAIRDRAGAWVMVSKDRGATLEPHGRAQAPDGRRTHNEHMVVEQADGRLQMLIRTTRGIARSTSDDGGATWTEALESGIPHTSSRFFFRRLQSGHLLLVKNGPMELPETDGEPPTLGRTHMTAYLSRNEGRSWSGGLLLEERGCTYPDGTQAPDGTIYVIYDHGRRTDKEILLARFTEEDLLAGRPVSNRARLRLLVNKATGVIPEAEDWSLFKGKDDPDQPLIFTGI